MQKQLVLIGAKADLRFGLKQFQGLTKGLEKDHEVLAISSIFRVSHYDEGWEDWGQSLTVCFKIRTTTSAVGLYEYLAQRESALQKEAPRNLFQIYFLSYEDRVETSQNYNLPYPDFHRKPELLVPACEIYREYIHPVLNKDLAALGREQKDSNWGEFFAQGKVLRESQF